MLFACLLSHIAGKYICSVEAAFLHRCQNPAFWPSNMDRRSSALQEVTGFPGILSVPDGDSGVIQPHGLSNYQVFSLSSMRQPLLGYSDCTMQDNLTTYILISVHSVGSVPLEPLLPTRSNSNTLSSLLFFLSSSYFLQAYDHKFSETQLKKSLLRSSASCGCTSIIILNLVLGIFLNHVIIC